MPEHTIAENLARLQAARTAIGEAITAKGGTVDSGDGFEEFPADIAAIPSSEPVLMDETVTPTTSQQTIVAGEGYNGLGTVTVEAVTAAIDSDIVAGNIKKDVEILGVTGTYDYNAKFAMTTGQFTLANNIVAIELPDGLTAISNTAFSGATYLKTIEIPNSVTVINATAFSGCTELSTIIINKAQDSITGAPWSAPNATVVWTG